MITLHHSSICKRLFLFFSLLLLYENITCFFEVVNGAEVGTDVETQSESKNEDKTQGTTYSLPNMNEQCIDSLVQDNKYQYRSTPTFSSQSTNPTDAQNDEPQAKKANRSLKNKKEKQENRTKTISSADKMRRRNANCRLKKQKEKEPKDLSDSYRDTLLPACSENMDLQNHDMDKSDFNESMTNNNNNDDMMNCNTEINDKDNCGLENKNIENDSIEHYNMEYENTEDDHLSNYTLSNYMSENNSLKNMYLTSLKSIDNSPNLLETSEVASTSGESVNELSTDNCLTSSSDNCLTNSTDNYLMHIIDMYWDETEKMCCTIWCSSKEKTTGSIVNMCRVLKTLICNIKSNITFTGFPKNRNWKKIKDIYLFLYFNRDQFKQIDDCTNVYDIFETVEFPQLLISFIITITIHSLKLKKYDYHKYYKTKEPIINSLKLKECQSGPLELFCFVILNHVVVKEYSPSIQTLCRIFQYIYFANREEVLEKDILYFQPSVDHLYFEFREIVSQTMKFIKMVEASKKASDSKNDFVAISHEGNALVYRINALLYDIHMKLKESKELIRKKFPTEKEFAIFFFLYFGELVVKRMFIKEHLFCDALLFIIPLKKIIDTFKRILGKDMNTIIEELDESEKEALSEQRNMLNIFMLQAHYHFFHFIISCVKISLSRLLVNLEKNIPKYCSLDKQIFIKQSDLSTTELEFSLSPGVCILDIIESNRAFLQSVMKINDMKRNMVQKKKSLKRYARNRGGVVKIAQRSLKASKALCNEIADIYLQIIDLSKKIVDSNI